MADKLKVLLLSAPIGAGHLRAAEAVAKAICQLAPQAEVKHADVFSFLPPFFGKSILGAYFKILSLYPQAYGALYGWGNTSSVAVAVRNMVNKFFADRMKRFVADITPTIIVCTHATPAGLAAYLRQKELIDIPVVAVVTDFVVHRLWVYNEISHYFVTHEDMRRFLLQYGIGYERSHAMGIPVDFDPHQTDDKTDLRSLGLSSERKTILIMGGGGGMLPMERVLLALNASVIPLQIIAVTGTNKQLYQRLRSLNYDARHSVRVLGYVHNIPQLMSISDILISKPGGMTVAEAMCAGIPLIIYRPIPGQEEANTGFLIDKQAAIRVDSTEEVYAAVMELLQQNDKMRQLSSNALQLGKPKAAQDIASVILAMHNS